jgi:hypothetical protein
MAAASLCLLACAGRGESEAQQVGAVSLVTVLPGSANLAIGDSIQMQTVLIGPRGDTLRDVPVEWRSANTAIAKVSPNGRVHALGTGLAGITAVSGGKTGTARVIVAPPGAPRQTVAARQDPPAAAPAPVQRPPVAAPSTRQATANEPPQPAARTAPRARAAGDAAHPNEPPGFRRLADRAFLTKARNDDDRGDKDCRGGSECWDGIEYRYGKFAILEDPSAPFSCCTIARMRYPAGHRSGTAPATVQTLGFRPPVEELYVSIWARLSGNWFGNQSSTNKMFFLGIGRNANNIFLSAEGAGAGPLVPQIRLQGVPDERRRLPPNLRRVTLTRGQWQHWEFYFKMNDPGQPNGVARLWIDGQPATDVQNVMFRRPNESSARWWIFHWSPTYGGGGAPPPADQFLDFDHVYVSGR